MPPLFGPLAGAGWDYSQLGERAGAKAYGLPMPAQAGLAGADPRNFLRRAYTGGARGATMPLPARPLAAPVALEAQATGLEPPSTVRPALFGPFAQIGGYRTGLAVPPLRTGMPRF